MEWDLGEENGAVENHVNHVEREENHVNHVEREENQRKEHHEKEADVEEGKVFR